MEMTGLKEMERVWDLFEGFEVCYIRMQPLQFERAGSKGKHQKSGAITAHGQWLLFDHTLQACFDHLAQMLPVNHWEQDGKQQYQMYSCCSFVPVQKLEMESLGVCILRCNHLQAVIVHLRI
jgi:hypothetical protein